MKRILVIDDESIVLNVLERMLKRDFEVVATVDGADGVRLYQQQPFDLVISDVLMPGKGGLEVVQDILTFDPTARVIVMSGGTKSVHADEHFQEAETLGAVTVLEKPFSQQQLHQIVHEAIFPSPSTAAS